MADALYRVALGDGTCSLAFGDTDVGPQHLLSGLTLNELLAEPSAEFWERLEGAATAPLPPSARVVAPIESQEVWAAGVTYRPSRDARKAESPRFAAAYDAVFEAQRPELFFKTTGLRVRGPGESIAVRSDSTWNVPEPEVALAITSTCEIAAITIGNDASSRSIEGTNPLYLPQAKVYDGSCALGPCLTRLPDDRGLSIDLMIERAARVIFRATTNAASMVRTFEELTSWLGRALTFPNGAFLLTGTGIIPPASLSLAEGDLVTINVAGIGSLVNPVRSLACGTPPEDEVVGQPRSRPANEKHN
jgi:2-dehydro-3-deoxy-D-arabinonate dehydratase